MQIHPHRDQTLMEISYIFHSGFAIETDGCILVFDFWMDPSGIMSRLLTSAKPMYVFSSHFHEDHFNPAIFRWKQQKTNITYLLSKDILKRRRAHQEQADIWLAKGAHWSDHQISVWATGSNDSGVSWIVEVEGKRIFHAGDLNNWYARFLNDGQDTGTIISEEFGEINPREDEKRFLGELKDIAKIATHFDIVMFPVDGRIGNGYTLGGRQFTDRFSIGLFIPMHFVASGFESAWRMEPFCQEKNIPFWSIQKEGDCITYAHSAIIRQSTQADLPRMQEIFGIARQFMAETGNPNQWAPSYPCDEQLLSDISSGDSYVILHQGRVIATFLLRGGDDPTYSQIYDGQWPNQAPYATIHRIASSGEVKGIFTLALQYALHHYSSIRIDTHRDNKVMQHAILKAGFIYCGIIHCWNGAERLAYQYTKQE